MFSFVVAPDDNHHKRLTWYLVWTLSNIFTSLWFLYSCLWWNCKYVLNTFASPYPNFMTNEKDKSALTIGKLGSSIIFIFMTAFQLAWGLSAMKLLKFTFDTSFSDITEFKFFQKSVWVIPSLECMSQHAMVNTLHYLLLYTWYIRMVQSFRRNLHISSHLYISNKIYTIFWEIYTHFQDKYFVFGLSRKYNIMDVLKAQMIFKRHDTIQRTHSIDNKAFWARYKITTIWRGNSSEFIHDDLQ